MMNRYFTVTLKLCLIFLTSACSDSSEEPTANQLFDYWNMKVDLSQTEQKELALQAIETSGDPYLKAISNFIMGYYSMRDVDHKAALEHYVQAEYDLAASEKVDSKLLGHIYRNRGFIAEKYSQYEKAVTFYDAALRHYNRFPEDLAKERMAILNSKGLVLQEVDLNQSLTVFETLIQEARLNKNINYEAKALRLIGEAHIDMNDYDKAEAFLKEAIDLFDKENLKNPRLQYQLFRSLSRLNFYLEKYEEQEDYLRLALDLNIPYKSFRLKVDLGENLYKQGKKKEAYELLSTLEKGFDQQPTNKDNLFIYELLTEISPANARVGYQEKWEQAKARYDQETQSIDGQLRTYYELLL
ncbi:MAG: tetratricopeptide repeat protein, partial [Bacteroidota bacterium]